MSRSDAPAPKGRGAGYNPGNRFETTHRELELDQVARDDEYLAALGRPLTQYLTDRSRSIIAENDSPDVGFDASINPYRGCEHGCIYCYARPTHEYLGYSAGVDFETRILVKEDAPALLRVELASPRWKPRVLGLSGVTDPYQPLEREKKLTRRCLEVLAEFRQAVTIITKNRLVTRDIDVLSELAKHNAAGVFVSITTLDSELTGRLEPRTTRPLGRIEAIARLNEAGIPTGVMVAPIIPGLNEHEVPAILDAAARAGARNAGFTLVRLPLAVAPLFQDWLDRHYPDRKDKILDRIRAMRGGRLNDSRFGVRMGGEGPHVAMIARLFRASARRVGLNAKPWPVSPDAFCPPGPRQLSLF
ncbi:MAG: PA0069 family radical SAM protein [Isosphaeraceae bacterium]